MNRKWIALFIVLVACVATTHAGIWNTITSIFPKHIHVKPMGVRVLVMHDQPGATIGVKGKYKLYDPKTKESKGTRFVGKTRYMEASSDGLHWHEQFPGLYQLLIVSDDKDGYITINDVQYDGMVYVYNVEGTITIVNELPLEDYLKGLLAGQFHDQMDQETLAAIAIAARTEALYQVEHPRNKFWAVDGNQVGYKGQENANPASPISHAIEETHGMVMTVGEGEPQFFPAKWDTSVGATTTGQYPKVLSKISLDDAENMAREGLDAMAILTRAFPGAKLQLSGK